MKAPKKLIEVALPLDDINSACVLEKQPFTRQHPRSLHIWWARRPLAAARAILFAQLVNDPGGERGWQRYPGQTKADAARERERLFDLIRRLVTWENTTNEELLDAVRGEILKSWRETCDQNNGKPGFDPNKPPPFHDPFAGGGSIPLEAQRLGLEAYASDLNPVAVLINKSLLEIPSRFIGCKPVGPVPDDGNAYKRRPVDKWPHISGMAEDLRRYGYWIHQQALGRIGHLYPEVELPPERGGAYAPVIAWIWARTVRSPNPAFSHVQVPLVKSFVLSSKKGKEAWLHPIVEEDSYRFEVRSGLYPPEAKEGTKLSRGANFRCIVSNTPINPRYIKAEGKAGRLGQRLIAVVAEGNRQRIYLAPTPLMEQTAMEASPSWRPETSLPDDPRAFTPILYGISKHGDLFTSRQLVALTTLSELVCEVHKEIHADAISAGWPDDGVPLCDGGEGAVAYADAIAVYLALAVSRWADMSNTICTWNTTNQNVRAMFSRQALSMTWDFVELSPFSSVGPWISTVESIRQLFQSLPASPHSYVSQCDAATQELSHGKVVSTDPPYYDNIGYADLSDFFYVWLRRSLQSILPGLFSTMVSPKEEELVATSYRHGGKSSAEHFFMQGMTKAISNLALRAHPAYPTTIYYAFKQSETKEGGTVSTGWETFLDAVVHSGFSITGTWPLRSERPGRIRDIGSNALASSILLVCRKREEDAPSISRRDFLRELKSTLPDALDAMIGVVEGASPVAPVDLAQAAIGPGMAIFSRYSAVLEADGSAMGVHDALVQINRALDEHFAEAEGDFDGDTRFCIAWFEQFGFREGIFGEADVLARAKGTSVEGVQKSGVLEARGGKVRLFGYTEYPANWDPTEDSRVPVWEGMHQLIRALRSGGEVACGTLVSRMPEKRGAIRQLAYRLYTLCERKGWAEEARAYNELITSWPGILVAAEKAGVRGTQRGLFDGPPAKGS